MTTSITSPTPAAQDFAAALHEIESNLEVRRLMLVIANVIVPALVMAMTDSLTGSDYAESIAWFPRHIVLIVGLTLAIAGVLVTLILARCHLGLVVNGTKMRRATRGELHLAPLNWRGVTTNFTALTALSAGAGLALALSWAGWLLPAIIAGVALFILLMAYLHRTHGRALVLCTRLSVSWDVGEIPKELREEHARRSLDATTADTSVVVTMAAALFAGTFNGMTNVGGIPPELSALPAGRLLTDDGLALFAGYTLVSLLLSASMVIRLRIALADHSMQLSTLRGEQDDAYGFSPQERTFLLFLVVQLLAAVSAIILFWTCFGPLVGLFAGSSTLAVGMVAYPLRLRRAGALARARAA